MLRYTDLQKPCKVLLHLYPYRPKRSVAVRSNLVRRIGEQVLVRSLQEPERCYYQNYLDIVIVPADLGPYEVVNCYDGTTVTLHKTLLKDGFEQEAAE